MQRRRMLNTGTRPVSPTVMRAGQLSLTWTGGDGDAVVVIRGIDGAKVPPYDRTTETRKAGHRAKGISYMEQDKGRPPILRRKGVIAIPNTMPQEAAPMTRAEALQQWVKRTQVMLAYRSKLGRSFSQLYNLMRTKRLVEVALDNVLENTGAQTAGVDGITKKDLQERKSRTKLIEEINRELCDKTYSHQPVRRVYIPKASGGQRPLGIPTLKDRVVQEMLRLILEPIYESKFYAHSYGFRPFRSTHHAALRLHNLISNRGYNIAIEGDIRKCFDRIHHVKLLTILRQTIEDERIIKIIEQMLTAGVMEDGVWQVTEEGTPQGGVVSPLLANIYLHELDQYIAAKWDKLSSNERKRRQYRRTALPCYIVRYADDWVILIKGNLEQAAQIKADVARFLEEELHLELSAEKTHVTEVTKGFDFLGFNIRKHARATLITPSQTAMQRFRTKVKEKIESAFSAGDRVGIAHLNHFLIGWGGYYRRVSSSRHFAKADYYVWWRLFRTTHQRCHSKMTWRQHFRTHYIPYRHDVRRQNRRFDGANYGVWLDEAHTQAFIVTRLSFLPIRYVRFHPQLNPYVPAERQELERVIGTLEPPPDQLPGLVFNPDYGPEWQTIRREVLLAAGRRCQLCNRPISGRNAHVHHRTKVNDLPRKQANQMANLVALCSACHSKAERGLS